MCKSTNTSGTQLDDASVFPSKDISPHYPLFYTSDIKIHGIDACYLSRFEQFAFPTLFSTCYRLHGLASTKDELKCHFPLSDSV